MDEINYHDPSGGEISRERLLLIANNTPLLVAYVGADGRYQFNNDTYSKWFGVHALDLRGKEVKEVIGDEAYHAIRHHLESALAGNIVTYDMPMQYARAGRRFVRTTLVPEKGVSGVVLGFMLFVSDDTTLYDAQTQITSAYERLLLTSSIGRTVRSSADPQEIMTTTTAALGQAMGADRCYYVTYDQHSDHSVVGPEWSREGISSIAGVHRMSDYGPNRRADYLAGQTDIIEDAFLLADSAVARKLGVRAAVRAPIQQDGRTTALVVAMATEPRRWTEQEITLVETIVSQTRGAMEVALARQRERNTLREVLAAVTGGKFNLVFDRSELPAEQGKDLGRKLKLTPTDGLRDLRHLVRQAAYHAGYSDERQNDLLTVASEAGMNAIVHAGEGVARVRLTESGMTQIWIEDQGKGIATADLPRAALARGYSTQGTLGHGIKMMLDTCDRMHLLTGSRGTIVVLEQDATPPSPSWLNDLTG
ncbi:hypothetical protein CCAX7_36100 [Capsulimonas corticalis]|uniref:Uncharacterized protein n=1 Tax=Capsulimonas corticalis TaxID=2219043 RepID=A0A402D6Z2_9BACT|nr:GAF domain-containing protein [Capsulimonas corticalis]BDI31559.1 hypothetical protein CCAX7_36100 [Capsulimonas corticalis]